jgi:hypothetical protein
MKQILKTHNLTSNIQYFVMILNSFKNGNRQEALDQFKALPRKERKGLVKSLLFYWGGEHLCQNEKELLIDLI